MSALTPEQLAEIERAWKEARLRPPVAPTVLSIQRDAPDLAAAWERRIARERRRSP